jgi:plasmid stabilization system protein ParE
VGTFRLSRLAESDLIGISNYGLSTWGAERAIDYIDSLESCCQLLADNPKMGRLCEHTTLPFSIRVLASIFPSGSQTIWQYLLIGASKL